eukprot:TRINITY_DN36952_c0_g1_i1.p1 TRINITY_DN36952_c0_g1~~TRINITY_DN36952_c0_g1_i1.p1  ORF type:complete len:168 (+),score=40.00 TRINITY_DN36952_c0_g1_i1:49-552(+)
MFEGVYSLFFFFQAEDGIRDVERSRGLGDVYKRQAEYMGLKNQVKVNVKSSPDALMKIIEQLQSELHSRDCYIQTLLNTQPSPPSPTKAFPLKSQAVFQESLIGSSEPNSVPITKINLSICQNPSDCLLYTSDAADDTPCVDLGGRRIIKKKKRSYGIPIRLNTVHT